MRKKAYVLVVDDEKDICDVFRETLTEEGYKTSTVLNGVEGLKKVEVERPDIVLLDLKLPDIDGIEVLRQIKKIDKNIVVIMITGYGTMETARMAMRLGAYDYITKPFDLEYVKAVVKDGLKSTLQGFVEEVKRKKVVRLGASRAAKLAGIKHCSGNLPCLWEVAIKAFVLGDDQLVVDWMENPKVSQKNKADLMQLVKVLAIDTARKHK